ncbi:HD domain-containing protein [Galbibacter sp.]|uniref:HD domain-containing protein n=1 Tax=Galbibacter sp. TaxID=2918471 RepID=UPI002BA91AF4|nr:HD domain-containing protein [Galbibacter sp.]HLV63955.1 HD domain-containing protein [Galbibacter sp.]
MDNTQITEKTISFVKQTLKDAEGGHDWFHIQRVFKNAMLIAKDYPQASPLVVALGALLHDIADSKFHKGDETVGGKMAEDFLTSLSVEPNVITQVVAIIDNISFRGGNFKQTFRSIELDIVQDADRLDAIGAIGIARCFNYGGFKNRKLYDPAISPNLQMTKEEYKKSTAPTINHFYEKLLLLKDRMNTDTGKKLAQRRHEFMELFLEQFYAEIDGER